MRDSEDGHPAFEVPADRLEFTPTSRTRLARQEHDLRIWDLLQLGTPWLLLAISTAIYFSWTLPASGEPYWPTGAAVLGLVAVTVIWVLLGHSLPLKRKTLRPASNIIYFVGFLILCLIFMMYSEVFIILTIAGFFHAYLLTPWPVGVLGVLATSVILNGSTLLRDEPTPETLAMFILIVLVQTAAIGVGIPFSARAETEDRKREKLVEQLEAALHENAGLHAQLLVQARESGVLDERQRLASEIHDTLAQGLAGIITQLQAAKRSAMPDDKADAHVERALQLARISLTEARRSVRALAPQELGVAQLPGALHTLSERWSQNEGIEVHVEITGSQVPLSPAIDVSLFRVAQEALTNVAKHAGATRVGLTLSYTGPEVLLDVRDDGRGFIQSTSSGFGLTSMRQRIRGVGGQVEVQSAPGEGTSVSARVPAIAPSVSASEKASDR